MRRIRDNREFHFRKIALDPRMVDALNLSLIAFAFLFVALLGMRYRIGIREVRAEGLAVGKQGRRRPFDGTLEKSLLPGHRLRDRVGGFLRLPCLSGLACPQVGERNRESSGRTPNEGLAHS